MKKGIPWGRVWRVRHSMEKLPYRGKLDFPIQNISSKTLHTLHNHSFERAIPFTIRGLAEEKAMEGSWRVETVECSRWIFPFKIRGLTEPKLWRVYGGLSIRQQSSPSERIRSKHPFSSSSADSVPVHGTHRFIQQEETPT